MPEERGWWERTELVQAHKTQTPWAHRFLAHLTFTGTLDYKIETQTIKKGKKKFTSNPESRKKTLLTFSGLFSLYVCKHAHMWVKSIFFPLNKLDYY